MIKRLLFGLVLLFVATVGVSYFYLGSLAKSGIEYAGEYALKTEVNLQSVTLSPLSGKGRVRGLSVANPEGYSPGPAISLGAIEVELNLGSVLSDVVEIDLLRLAQPQINYETKITTDNLRALLANLPSAESSQPAGASTASAKQIILRRVEILGPQLKVVTALGAAPVTLPDIILTDIGGEGGGASVTEAAELVLRELLGSIGAANLPRLDQLRDGVEERARAEVDRLESRLEERVEEVLGTEVENLSDRLRSLRN